MESRPKNPEFRNNPENFHPWQQRNGPNYHDRVKERLQKWQYTCWSQEVWKLHQHLSKIHLLN